MQMKCPKTGTTTLRMAMGTLQLLLLMMLLLGVMVAGVEGGRKGRRRHKRGSLKCSASSVAEFRLTFHGLWSEDAFPRMYPRHRPTAHWSKLVGRSHAPDYQMWRLGQKADPAVKKMAEQGVSTLYDNQPQGYRGLYDAFFAQALTSGEGWTSTFFLADGRHSRMSFMVKLVPSPDWFVGVDSLDLCRRGRWRERAHVNLRPVDGGTDRGYTFTAPNWPSQPPEPVYRITSSFPDHPAAAFLYPEIRRLPRIAYVEVERVAQYFRRGPLSPIDSNRTVNIKVFRDELGPSSSSADNNTTSDVLGEATTITLAPVRAHPGLGFDSDLAGESRLTTSMADLTPQPRQPPKADVKRRELPSLDRRTPAGPPATTPSPTLKASSRRTASLARYGSEANVRKSEGERQPSNPTEPTGSQSQHSLDQPQFLEVSSDGVDADGAVDCLVGEWADWSACSKTCSFGVRIRTRDVISHSQKSGLACPVLQQEVLCGSMRTCKWNHFSFLAADRKPAKKMRRRRRLRHDDQKYRRKRDHRAKRDR